MPKFLVTSGSYFQPYTYDELAKPITQAVEAHNATQDVYDQLGMETAALGRYISDNPGDSDAKMLYENYLSRLNSLQENLWNNGYNASTRRDLSAARAGYASDITRLQTAIKARQERSKEYWDARHKNPNLVTGMDPGLGGLNDYLRDDNYGNNWFSYDSAQFEKDVFEESKARAKSMIRNLTDENGVVKNPALKDQLTRVIEKGFTNDEVDAASVLVDALLDMSAKDRERFYATNSDEISPIVKMLTESLINRYDATGIRGYDVSDSEKQKLINRGKAGLVGGIMEPDIKDFSNPDYEFDIWKQKENIQHQHRMEELGAKGGNGSGSGSGGNDAPKGTYSLETLSSYLDSPEAKEITSYANKQFVNKFEEPIPITGINGEPDTISSAYDVERIFDDLGRKRFMDKWGVDPTENVIGTHNVPSGGGSRSSAGSKRTISSASGGYASGKNGEYTISYDGNISETESREFSNDIKKFRENYAEWKKDNRNVDLYDLKIRNKDWDKMQSEYDLSGIPREYWPAVLAAKADIGYRTPSYLASYTEDMPEVRENYANAMYSAYVNAPKKDGKVEKTSDVAVKKISPDGKVIGIEQDMRNVLGTKGSGKGNKEINTGTIMQIHAFPEDVLQNQLRFTTSTYDGIYAANPSIFGNRVDAVYRKFREPVVAAYSDGSTEMIDRNGIVDYMMKPITDPASAFRMSDAEKRQWTNITANTLSGYMKFYATDSNGNVTGSVSPITIVLYPEYREALRSAVTNYINAGLSGPRDVLNREILQKRSSSVANPGTMDLGLTNQ